MDSNQVETLDGSDVSEKIEKLSPEVVVNPLAFFRIPFSKSLRLKTRGPDTGVIFGLTRGYRQIFWRLYKEIDTRTIVTLYREAVPLLSDVKAQVSQVEQHLFTSGDKQNARDLRKAILTLTGFLQLFQNDDEAEVTDIE